MMRILRKGERYVLHKPIKKNNYLSICRKSGLVTLLICLFSFQFVCLAQSSRLGGTTGKGKVLEIPKGGVVIGDSLPEEFWQQELFLINHPQGKSKVSLSAYRHKLLVLDFFNTACRPCVRSIDQWNELQKDFKLEVTVLPIHLYGDNGLISKFAETRDWDLPISVGNKADTLMNQLFYVHKSFGQIWILDGKLLAIPHNKDVSKQLIGRALTRRPLEIEMNDFLTYFDRRFL